MRRPLLIGALLCAFTLPQSGWAQSTASLSPADATSSGRVAVNIAAGHSNQEANVAVIAVGGHVSTPTALLQAQESGSGTGGPAIARIEEQTLAGSSGLVAVNVVAGHHNQLANVAVIAIGFEAPPATALLLDQARASQQPTGAPDDPLSHEAIADLGGTAFAGSSGLVQVNLVGGERNSSSNTFALTFAGD